MTNNVGGIVDKKSLINSLIFNNIKYIKNYSEFLSDSFYLNWNKLLEAPKKERYFERINKNIDKLKKIELRQLDEKYLQEIIIGNLLFINTELKKYENRFSKKIMDDIQKKKSLGELIEYLVDSYYSLLDKEVSKDNKLSDAVSIIKFKKKEEKVQVEDVKHEIILNVDKNGYYYYHIYFLEKVMHLDVNSFNLEVNNYNKNLLNNDQNPFYIDSDIKYSSFEKRRRIYIKSMFDLDRTINNLINKDIDITYPIDKVVKCALDIVDNIYKEVVNYNDDKTILNKLMELTILNYGSRKKIGSYNRLIQKIENTIPMLDEITKLELLSAKDIIIEKGYVEFRNIVNYIPDINDIYSAANEKIINYLCKNSIIIMKNFNNLQIYTKYMNIKEIVKLYNDLKENMLINRVSTKSFIDLQKNVFSLIKSRCDMSDDDIFSDVIKEEKIF